LTVLERKKKKDKEKMRVDLSFRERERGEMILDLRERERRDEIEEILCKVYEREEERNGVLSVSLRSSHSSEPTERCS